MSAEVRERASLADEVVDEHVVAAGLGVTGEEGLSGQAGEARCARMADEVGLDHGEADRPGEATRQFRTERRRDRVHTGEFQRMDWQQDGGS